MNVTAVSELQAYIDDKVSGCPEISVKDICKEIEAAFPSNFFERLGREGLSGRVYQIVQRHTQPAEQARRLRSALKSVESPKFSAKVQSIFAAWHEEVMNGTKVLIMKMSVADLNKAIDIRTGRSEREMRHANWLIFIRDEVKRRRKKYVEDVFTDEQLADSYDRLVGGTRSQAANA